MTLCQKCASKFDRFLDGELEGNGLVKFELHLKQCSSCRRKLDEQRLFLESIRAARPKQNAHAPLRLRQKVTDLLSTELTSSEASSAIGADLNNSSEKKSGFVGLLLRQQTAFALSAAAALGVLVVWTFISPSAKADAFVQLAMEKHRQQLAGQLPLKKLTGSPAEMVAWFSNRVAFPFRLPNYQGAPGSQPTYTLLGGRVIKVNQTDAAYVAYSMQQQLVSLIVIARSDAVVKGGETTEERGLVFHSRENRGLQVITWSVHDVTYALVASATLPGRESCVVCHSGPEDKYLFKKPATHARSPKPRQRLLTSNLLRNGDCELSGLHFGNTLQSNSLYLPSSTFRGE